MNPNDLDRILSGEKEILPSSGFAASVMEAVRREATAPPPLGFPWKRALPGAIVSCLALVWALIEGAMQVAHGGTASLLPASSNLTFTAILRSPKTASVCWIVLALLLSYASVKLSLFLSRSSVE